MSDENEEFEFRLRMEREADTAAPTATMEPPNASLADKMVGGWGGRMALGMASPVLAATQMLGGEKGRAAVAELDAMKKRGMAAEGKEGFDWYGLMGSMVPGAGIAKGVTAALPAATGALGRIGTGAAVGAATSAAQPVTTSPDSDFWNDKANQALLGGAVGAVAPTIGAGVKALRGGGPQLNPTKAATLAEGQAAGSTERATVDVQSLKEKNPFQFRMPEAGISKHSVTTGPITLDATGSVTDGNHRLREAIVRGDKTIEVMRPANGPGYVVQPSKVNPSFLTNRLESIAGKASVGQEAAKRNQGITNALAAKSLGLPKDTTITPEVLNDFRAQHGKVYEEISSLSKDAKGALDTLKQARHDSKVQWNFYNRSGNPEALTAAKNADGIAEMATDELGREAREAGRSELVKELADARVKIAKSYDVTRALNASSGEINAPTMGKLFAKRGEKAMTGELATIGKMANSFKDVMREGGNVPSPGVSGTDAAASALLGVAGAAGGGPMGILAGGLPLLRGPARNLVLSPAYQKFATSDPEKFQALVDALAQRGSAATGTAVGRAQQ